MLEVDENDRVELECSVQDEDAECDWFYEGEVSSKRKSFSFFSHWFPSQKIDLDSHPGKYEIISTGKIRKLIINNASPVTDKGKYECKTGVMTTSCNLTARGKICFIGEIYDD